MKLRKKFTAVFVGLALLGVVVGFCDSLIDSASASMHDVRMMENQNDEGQVPSDNDASFIRQQQKMPLNNSVKPCCEKNYNDSRALQATNFNYGIKLLPLGVNIVSPSLTAFFENKLNTSSDPSPPKPDELSSVLRIE